MIQKNTTPLKPYLKLFLGFPLTAISFFFIASFIYSGKDEILAQVSNFNPLPFFLGIFFLILFFLFRSQVWKELLKNNGYIVGTAESTFLLASSEIKRYIPGSILGFVSRVHRFGTLKIPAKLIVKLIFYESILFVITSALVSILVVFYLFSVIYDYFFIILALIIIAFILSIFVVLRFDLPKSWLRLKSFEKSFLLMLFAWVFYGLGNFLVAISFVYIDPTKILQIVSLFVGSWLVGYLIVIIPMGLGVREAAVTYSLSTVLPVSIAATVALIVRIAFIISEVLFLGITYIFYKFTPLDTIHSHLTGFIKIERKISYHAIILWSSIISYTAYFTYYSFEKHANFSTGRFDLGNMDQTVWNTLNGRIFQLTNPDGIETISRLAIHADFILILLSPFYLIWEDPRTLLFIQTVILGLGAYCVYKIANHILKNSTVSTVLGISYLLNPFVQKQNLFDFHAVVLSTTFLLAAFYFTLVKKYKFFFLFLILSVLTKENVYLTASIFGIYLFLKTSREAGSASGGKNKKWLFLTFAGVLIFYIVISKLIPWVRGGQHFATEYFVEFGDTPSSILRNLIWNPIKTFSSLLTQSNFSYLYKLFLPVGFVSILAPFILFFAAPDLAINLLSQNENLRTLTFHYAATIIPFVYLSAIFGIKKILNFRFKFTSSKFISYSIIVFSIFASWQYGVLPGAKNPSIDIYTNPVSEKRNINRFLEAIPQNLSVASSNNLGAHLSHRTKLFTIPYGINEADVIVFLLNDPYAKPSLSEQREYARILQNNPLYIELARFGDFIAFAKRDAASKIRSVH